MNLKTLLVAGTSFIGMGLFTACELPNLPILGNDCIAGTVRVCHNYRDQWGRLRYECNDVYDRCASRRSGGGFYPYAIAPMTMDEAIALNISDEISAPTEDIGPFLVSPARFATRFNLSIASATRVVDALRDVNDTHDTAKLLALGFAPDDVANMALMTLPSDSSIEKVSKNLDQDPLFTKGMLSMIRLWAAYEIQQRNASEPID